MAGINLVGVPQPKPLHGFSPNFIKEDLELIRFWGYPVITVAMATLLRFSNLKLCGCSRLNPSTDLHQIFRICLPQVDLQLMRFWVHPAATVTMATL